jgi:hypothetical protein
VPDTFRPAGSPYGRFQITEALRPFWLWSIGAVGLLLVAVAVALNLVWGVENIVPSASLEVGVGMLLFSAFFLAERKIVRSTSVVPLDPLAVVAGQTGQDLEELREDHEGPYTTVQLLVDAVMADDFERAWALLSPNLRLCRAQQWLWVNRSHPTIAGLDLDIEANALASLDFDNVHWPAFSRLELDDLQSRWADPDIRGCGYAMRRREVEAGRIIQLVDLGGTNTAYIVDRTTEVRAHVFLVSPIDGAWRVSSLSGDTPPTPGMPPEWNEGWKYFEELRGK